jgi:hypothetical protein
MPLRPSERNRVKLAALSVKHNVSQNELIDIILDSVDEVVANTIVVEMRSEQRPRPRTLTVRKIATWG